jgi:hypothetical protein
MKHALVMTATLLAASTIAASAAGVKARSTAPGCPVTKPDNWPRPGWYGNGRLAVVGYQSIKVTPRALMPNGWIRELFSWWGEKRLVTPASAGLTTTGRRLDMKAKPLRAAITRGKAPNFAKSWLASLMFPSAGCWKITGRFDKTSLTVVTRIVDPLGLTKRESK